MRDCLSTLTGFQTLSELANKSLFWAEDRKLEWTRLRAFSCCCCVISDMIGPTVFLLDPMFDVCVLFALSLLRHCT